MRSMNRSEKMQLFGWLLFLISAFLSLAAGIESGSFSAIGASVIFLVACMLFIIPLVSGSD